MKIARGFVLALLVCWMVVGFLNARLYGFQNAPFNFVNVGASARIAWRYPFEVMQAARFNSIRFIGLGLFSTGDIGAEANAAYRDLPALSYAKIVVVPKVDGSCYAATTPISFSIVGKGVLLELLPGVCIQTSTSAAFLTFNFCGPGGADCGGGGPTSQRSYGLGLIGHGAWISGPGKGGASVAISVGGTNGTEGLRIEGVEIDSFASCLQDAGNSFQVTVKDVSIMNCGKEVNLSRQAEIWKFEGGKIGDNRIAMPKSCVTVDGPTQAVFSGTSFDSCQLVINGGHVTGYGLHIENSAGNPAGCTANPYIVVNRGTLALFDPEIWNDCGNGPMPAQLIDTGTGTGNAEYLQIYGGAVHNPSTQSNISQIIRQQGGISVNVCGLQNNSAAAYPFANGVVLRKNATGPTIVCPSTAGSEGASTYTPFEIASAVTIGGGSTVNAIYNGSAILTYTAISPLASQDQTITIIGASTKNFGVFCSPRATLGSANLSWSAWVSGANRISVRVTNLADRSVTPSPVSWGCTVNQ